MKNSAATTREYDDEACDVSQIVTLSTASAPSITQTDQNRDTDQEDAESLVYDEFERLRFVAEWHSKNPEATRSQYLAVFSTTTTQNATVKITNGIHATLRNLTLTWDPKDHTSIPALVDEEGCSYPLETPVILRNLIFRSFGCVNNAKIFLAHMGFEFMMPESVRIRSERPDADLINLMYMCRQQTPESVRSIVRKEFTRLKEQADEECTGGTWYIAIHSATTGLQVILPVSQKTRMSIRGLNLRWNQSGPSPVPVLVNEHGYKHELHGVPDLLQRKLVIHAFREEWEAQARLAFIGSDL